MDIHEIWAKALKHTEIIRPRVRGLMTLRETQVPYLVLSESSVNPGDTVVRRGELLVEKPSLILPPHLPQFTGFEFENNDMQEDAFINFLLVRGISLPSLRYNNSTNSLNVYEGDIEKAIAHYKEMLQQEENVSTGLIAGPEDCWQFSVLIYICSQIVRNADADIRHLMQEFKKRYEDSR